MKRSLVAPVLAAVGVLLGAGSSQAGLFSSCCQPACNQEACNYPKIRYKTCYQTVVEEHQVTRCKTVQRCVNKEVRYTVCRPVEETQMREVHKLVCKPVWEEKKITVCGGEWKCEWVCQPGRCVTRTCKVRCQEQCDPCGCGGHRSLFPRHERICYTEQLPARYVSRKVWVPRQEVRTVKVCRNVQEEVVEKVPVKVCKMVREEVVKQVPVTICEKVPVTETVRVCKRVKTCVPVCEEQCGHRSLFHRHNCGYTDCTAAAPAPATAPAEKIPAPTKK
jgi:hypothetical protein